MKGGKRVQGKDKGKARGMTINKTGKKETAYRMKYQEISRQKEQCGQVSSGTRREINQKTTENNDTMNRENNGK